MVGGLRNSGDTNNDTNKVSIALNIRIENLFTVALPPEERSAAHFTPTSRRDCS